MDGPHFFSFQGFGDGITLKSSVAQSAYSPVRSYPEVPLAVFQQRTRTEIAKPIAHLVILETAPRPEANAFIGPNPDTAVPALNESADEVIHQPGFCGVVKQPLSHLAIHALAFGTNPQPARAITKDVADPDPVHARESIGRDFVLLETEEICGGNPDFPPAVFVHSFGVLVPGGRQ